MKDLRTFKIYPLILVLVVQCYSQTQTVIGPGLSGQDLWDFIYTNYKTTSTLGYINARDTLFSVIDLHDDSLLSCVYTGFTIALDPAVDPSTDAYDKGVNCEHTWPSVYHEPQISDMHQLFPCKVNVNWSRGSDPYAEIPDVNTDQWFRLDSVQTTIPTEYIDEYAEKEIDTPESFEPKEDHKGDAARAMFYFYAIYNDVANTNFWNVQKDILLLWHYNDPVDPWEYNRSNLIGSYQDNIANPFVLDSTLAKRIWFSRDSLNVTWHVSTTGSDSTGDGSVSNPFSTIQHGIDIAIDGDTVLVQPGTYIENIYFVAENIVLSSLFLTTGDTSYISQTVIAGDNRWSIVSFYSGEDSTAVLCGFTITNGEARDHGAILISESSPRLENVIITGNSASWGGGITFVGSSSSLENVTITGNSADFGGGINCDESSPRLENVIITGNSADWGGGIYCRESNPSLENVTITGNSASYGGGIYFVRSNPTFSTVNRSNIYLNNFTNPSQGGDIFSESYIVVIVDTFTVMQPTDYYASPIDSFSFNILNAVQGQADANLYVSPAGNNTNDGLTLQTPLQTIQYATSIILADSTNPHTIYLANGIYSPTTTGEYFPIIAINYVHIFGESESGVILDADNVAGVMRFYNTDHTTVSNLTLTGGSTNSGGGIYCNDSSPSLENVTITGNSATNGGGIYCRSNSNPQFSNVTIMGNSASRGGGIYCSWRSKPSFSTNNRCNIYLNNVINTGRGADIFSTSYTAVIVDTFTVMQPTDYYTSPIDSFSFDILNAVRDQVEGNIYISPFGSNTNDGLTPLTPLQTIQYAFSIIIPDSTNQHTFYLANGIYSPSTTGEHFPIDVIDYVSIVGESESGVILDADTVSSVMRFRNTNQITVSNLTITGGSALEGGGIYCDQSTPSLENITIANNSAVHHGGGIYCLGSSPSLENVTIMGNSTSRGGGIYCYFSNPILKEVAITGNSASNRGGGIYSSTSNPILKEVAITGNSASWGGGITFFRSSPSLENVTITGNSATNGGGIYCDESTPSLENITIADNSASSDGGGIFSNESSPSLINSVLWNNSPEELFFSGYYADTMTLFIAYSDIQGGRSGIITFDIDTIIWDEGNIVSNPHFINPDSVDYHLQSGSPCIDAGIDLFIWEGDTLVNIPDSLYNGSAPDMGALESSYILRISNVPMLPSKFTFYQNYPNPFNPVTTIHYDLPKRSDVQITIYDLLGRVVTTLVSETQDTGIKSIQWDATNVSSGMYFYQIRAGDFVQTRKMVLLK